MRTISIARSIALAAGLALAVSPGFAAPPIAALDVNVVDGGGLANSGNAALPEPNLGFGGAIQLARGSALSLTSALYYDHDGNYLGHIALLLRF